MIWLMIKYYSERNVPFFIIKDIFFVLCFVVLFFEYKRTWKQLLLLSIHFFLSWFVIVFINYWVLPTQFPSVYIYLIYTIIYYLIFGRKNLKGNLMYLLTYWTVYVFLSAFAKAIGSLMLDYIGYTSQEYAFIPMAIITPILLLAFSLMMKLMPVTKYNAALIGKQHILFSAIVCIISNISRFLVDSIQGTGSPVLSEVNVQSLLFIFFLGLVIFILDMFFYVFCYNGMKLAAHDEEIESKLLNIESLKNVYEEELILSKTNHEQLRKIRHDIKNQMAYMQIMMQHKDYNALEKYFNDFNEITSEPLNQIDCNNTTIRNILNLEKHKAKQENIMLEVKLIIPAKINISDYDITTLLLNLLDNAIEAIIEDKCQNAVININLQQKDNKLFVNVTNPITDIKKTKRRLNLLTGKQDKTIHGRGTKIIDSIAKKYEGAFLFKIEHGLAIADVVLSVD